MRCQHCGSEFGTPIQRREHELVCAAQANPSTLHAPALRFPPQLPLEHEQTTGERQNAALVEAQSLQEEEATLKQKTAKHAAAAKEKEDAAAAKAAAKATEEAAVAKAAEEAATAKAAEEAAAKGVAAGHATAAQESVVLQDPTEGNNAVPEELQCAVCQNPAPNLCSTCRRVRYCSRAHQVLTLID